MNILATINEIETILAQHQNINGEIEFIDVIEAERLIELISRIRGAVVSINN